MTVTVSIIKKAIRDKFPRIKKSSLEFVSVNLTCVVLGIKPSFLVERIPFQCQSPSAFKFDILCQIANEINKNIFEEALQTLGTLSVLGVQTSDFCFYNKRYLHQSLKERTLEVDYLIDITPNLPEPKVISRCSNIESLLTNLLEQLDQNLESEGFQIACLNSWNITTLFGLLLNYPIVYFYKEPSESGFCIDHQDLISYKLCTTIDNCESEIYCFSYPKSLEPGVSGKVDKWISKLLQKHPSVHFVCSKEVVNLDCVAL